MSKIRALAAGVAVAGVTGLAFIGSAGVASASDGNLYAYHGENFNNGNGASCAWSLSSSNWADRGCLNYVGSVWNNGNQETYDSVTLYEDTAAQGRGASNCLPRGHYYAYLSQNRETFSNGHTMYNNIASHVWSTCGK
ncbi:MAG: hypothetical protein JWN52_1836 [Actinomycetia bacterium]|nr:hypothetical protein [Actinomycetes bacterium]